MVDKSHPRHTLISFALPHLPGLSPICLFSFFCFSGLFSSPRANPLWSLLVVSSPKNKPKESTPTYRLPFDDPYIPAATGRLEALRNSGNWTVD